MKNFTFTLAVFLLSVSMLMGQQGEDPLKTKAKFNELSFDFGEIESGDRVYNVFVIENTGDKPLIIYNAKGSCGCTVPEWPKEPIMPGEEGEFLVAFDSKGKKGMVSKRVTISANTDPGNHYLTVKGKIMGKAEKPIALSPSDEISKEELMSIRLYPVPTSDYLNIEIPTEVEGKLNLRIFDQKGYLLEEHRWENGKNEIQINVANYPAGMYTFRIKAENGLIVARKFIVQ